MSFLFPSLDVDIGGQSNAIMGLTGSAEIVDTPMAAQPVAATRLEQDLAAFLPGVTVSVRGQSNGGDPPTYTAVSGNPLLVENTTGGNLAAWWNRATGQFSTHGLATRDYILARASPTRAKVYLHFLHSGDAGNSVDWSATQYGQGLTAFYEALTAACAPSFGAFWILPCIAGTRVSSDEARLSELRVAMEAAAGTVPAQSGATRVSSAIGTVHPGSQVANGGWQASSDFLHFIRSTAHRIVRMAAPKIAGRMGLATPYADQPRLCRARMLNATTLRATFVSPARHPLRAQGGHGLSLTAGTISAASAIDNSAVATTGYAWRDLTVSGVTAGARLRYLIGTGQYTGFVNGVTPPRGLLSRAMWADPGSIAQIGEDAEDVFSTLPVMHVAAHQTGVVVEPL
jgi:hypothetical protein